MDSISDLRRQVACREHVEELRRKRFNIGEDQQQSQLASMLQGAIERLSAELYQKDIRFVPELIQNAEDNNYGPGVTPSLEFVLTDQDVAEVGASATLLLFNNETGFQEKHMSSLCAVTMSTKKGQRNKGYVGEKGIGFKSVFLVTAQPHVISNGYRVRFQDMPHDQAGLGYIVPEWTYSPTDTQLSRVYRKERGDLPTTTLVLPLRDNKVEAVREQLKQISAETILFLSQVCTFTVREDSNGASQKALSITRETVWSKYGNHEGAATANSTVRLSVERSTAPKSSSRLYFLSQHSFPVAAAQVVEQRKNVDSWVLTLAFPLHGRIPGFTVGDFYAFLPTELTTGFPFLVNADFLLASSRETILFNNPWNMGILGCISEAFSRAFLCLLHNSDNILGSLDSSKFKVRDVYSFVPAESCNHPQLEKVRQALLQTLRENDGTVLVSRKVGHRIPKSGKFFCKAESGRRIQPAFRKILQEACEQGVELPELLLSGRCYIVDGGVQKVYNKQLERIGVPRFSAGEYAECLKSPNWISSLGEKLYVKLLDFVKENYDSPEFLGVFLHIPLIKYRSDTHEPEGDCFLLASVEEAAAHNLGGKKIYRSPLAEGEWLSKWTNLFRLYAPVWYIPAQTIQALHGEDELLDWLEEKADIKPLTVFHYAKQIGKLLPVIGAADIVILMTQFLFCASQGNYFAAEAWESFIKCTVGFRQDRSRRMPFVDDHGSVIVPGRMNRTKILLLPRRYPEIKWPLLFLDDAIWDPHVMRMADTYMEPQVRMMKDLREETNLSRYKDFLCDFLGAADVLDFDPPNQTLPARIFSISTGSIGKEQLFLLLTWITRCLKQNQKIPLNFLQSLGDNAWVQTLHHGLQRPSRCFLMDSLHLYALESTDVPVLDYEIYGPYILEYKNALRVLGVMVGVSSEDRKSATFTVAAHLNDLSQKAARLVSRESVTRLYRYLQRNSCSTDWEPYSPVAAAFGGPRIWIPAFPSHGTHEASWVQPADCVIRDKASALSKKLVPLERIYNQDREILQFFTERLKVSEVPGIESYCELWLEWTTTKHVVNRKECVKLTAPRDVFIPDDLSLAHMFATLAESLQPRFMWFDDTEIGLEAASKLCSRIGMKYLSTSVRKLGVPLSTLTSRDCYEQSSTGVRYVCEGLFRAILGYLSKNGVDIRKRHDLLCPLLATTEMTIKSSILRSYLLQTDSAVFIEAKETVMAYWERERKLLYRLEFEDLKDLNVESRTNFCIQFVMTIAEGLLTQHPSLKVDGLRDFLLPLVAFNFELEFVDCVLRHKNMQIYPEDEKFLASAGL
ncbi:unnamed protein product [Sphagnum tenellum]